jgi:hypothetical protein
MFDLRYHVASLAAVFLALVIGILVGVGISDPVNNAKTGLLEQRIGNLQKQLDQQVQQTGNVAREQDAARSFIKQTYPELVHNRLRSKHVAVVYVGSEIGAVPTAVNRTLLNAGGQQLRLRVLKVPVDARQIDKMLAAHPDAGHFTGPGRLEALGRALGAELVLGGDTPLWNVFTDALVEQQAGGSKDPADGVIVVRTAKPQRDGTSRFLQGLYSGVASAGVPAVGVETSDSRPTAIPIYRQAGLSSVDDIDTPAGRLSLALLLAGAPSGQYGLKRSADDFLPALQGIAPSGG